MTNFWQKLPKPIFVLAPLADVTDPAFRRVIAHRSAHKRRDGSVGGPDIMWTEFVSADGLVRATPEGKKKLMADLIYSESERPIVAQLFSSNEAHMEAAARLCLELGFDGVDINMGCPDRSVEKQGSGAALIRNPKQAKAILRAAKSGAQDGLPGGIPVSLKTRLGYNIDQLEDWLSVLLEEEPAAITIHARTRKEMSKVPARWERVAAAVALRDKLQAHLADSARTLILGNGDVTDLKDAAAKAAATGADGVMLGRAIFGNPWLFHPNKNLTNLPASERLAALAEHIELFDKLLSHKNFAIMKKHFKSYLHGLSATPWREQLMATNNADEALKIVHAFRNETLK